MTASHTKLVTDDHCLGDSPPDDGSRFPIGGHLERDVKKFQSTVDDERLGFCDH